MGQSRMGRAHSIAVKDLWKAPTKVGLAQCGADPVECFERAFLGSCLGLGPALILAGLLDRHGEGRQKPRKQTDRDDQFDQAEATRTRLGMGSHRCASTRKRERAWSVSLVQSN